MNCLLAWGKSSFCVCGRIDHLGIKTVRVVKLGGGESTTRYLFFSSAPALRAEAPGARLSDRRRHHYHR